MTSSLQHDNPEDYRYWPVELQVQHVQRAQEQVALGLPKFDAIFANAAGACENPCPELKALYGLFSGFCAELRQMYHTEHHFVFPYIRELAQCQRTGSEAVAPPFSSIHKVIPSIEARTRGPRALMNTLLDQGCRTAQLHPATGHVVRSLESLHQEISRLYSLKHNILYPRAVELENTVNRNSQVGPAYLRVR